MKLIASHPYIVVSRRIDWNEQHYVEQEHHLHLYEDQITSPAEKFLIDEIWDMSYKSSSTKVGFLYLHTNRGLYSFYVKSEPSQFINHYRKLKT